jgi:hypothetical protein
VLSYKFSSPISTTATLRRDTSVNMASLHTQGLPSPATTINSPAPSTVGSTLGGSALPTQRHHPLRPGSAKEIALINYVDDKVLLITRRYGTKFADIKTKKHEAPGYTSFDQVIADVDPLIDLVWSTGTRKSFYSPKPSCNPIVMILVVRLNDMYNQTQSD